MSSQTALNRINRAVLETVKQKKGDQKKIEAQENKTNRNGRMLIRTEKELTSELDVKQPPAPQGLCNEEGGV